MKDASETLLFNQHWLRLYNTNPGLLRPDRLPAAQVCYAVPGMCLVRTQAAPLVLPASPVISCRIPIRRHEGF